MHPSHETIELYVMGRLRDGGDAEVETHLIGCPECVAAAESIADFVALMREAFAQGAKPAADEPPSVVQGELRQLPV